MTEPVKPSFKRYILVKGGPDKPLDKMVKYKEGVGIRATAFANAESDFTHFVAIEGSSQSQVMALSAKVPTSSGSQSTTPCLTKDCRSLLEMLRALGFPSYRPPPLIVVFISIEFEVSIGEKKPTKIELQCEFRAGVVNKGGKRMLLELGSRSASKVEADLERIRAWKGVKRVRVLRTTRGALHRAPM